MHQEFLLKTEAPVIGAQASKSQGVVNQDSGTKTELKQAFSSELDKQIDQHSAVNAQAENKEVATDSIEAPHQQISLKAEVLLDKDGKALPTVNDITEEFVAQLLGDFDGEPALKNELTQIISQFVNTIANDESPEQGLADSLTALITQLVAGGSFDNNQLASQQAVGSVAADSDLKTLGDKALSVLQTNPVLAQIGNLIGQQALGQKTTIVNQVSAASQSTGQQLGKGEQLEQVQTVLQQIKEVVTKIVKPDSGQKSEQTALIAAFVQKMVPEKYKAAAQSEMPANKAASDSLLSSLRPDILQALPSKALSGKAVSSNIVALNNDDIMTTISQKGDVINLDQKKIDRVVQLVALLKPAQAEEKFLRPITVDKAFPSLTTAPLTTLLTSTTKADLPSLDIQPSLQSKAWSRVMSSRVVWMATEGIQQAALKLNPAHLGPVEVRLHLHHDTANVTFIAQNAATREALEQALPKLRDSFIENGIALANAEVSDQASQQAQDDETEQGSSNDRQGEIMTVPDNDASSEQDVTVVGQNSELGVNLYA